jgi:hypothetical protein
LVSLVDIIDLKKTVTIRGKALEVEGINAEKLGLLILSYPELRLMFAGKAVELSPQGVIALGPKIVASVIAAAIGKLGDEAEEAAAGKLALGEQLELLATIFELTFPDGVGPFVARLRSLGVLDSVAGASGWAPGTNSHAPSSPSQAMATGDARPS